jgi:hypothetical protein
MIVSSTRPDVVAELLGGRLASVDAGWPLCLRVVSCGLGNVFRIKPSETRGYRAVARNGRVLVATRLPLTDLKDRTVTLRIQTWNRRILTGDPARPWGILLCIEDVVKHDARPHDRVSVLSQPPANAALHIELGGRRWLAFSQT